MIKNKTHFANSETPQQYDAIGRRYNLIKQTPQGEVERASVEHEIGDVEGLRVLDLACGAGFYTKLLREWGASYAVGVDISPKMIEAAKEIHASDQHINFYVGDCGSPDFQLGDVDNEQFDVVFAGWLFNYAASEAELKNMFTNVYRYLKPDGRGRLVTIIPNPDKDGNQLVKDYYGIDQAPIAQAEHAWNVRTTLHTADEPISMETYRIKRPLLERCATEAGLKDLTLSGPSFPQDERDKEGYWDRYKKSPLVTVFKATT